MYKGNSLLSPIALVVRMNISRKWTLQRIAKAVKNADLEYCIYTSQKFDKVFMKIRANLPRLCQEGDRIDYQLRLDEKELRERILKGIQVRCQQRRLQTLTAASGVAGPCADRRGLQLENLPAQRRLGVHGRGDAHCDLRHGEPEPLAVVRVHLRQVRQGRSTSGQPPRPSRLTGCARFCTLTRDAVTAPLQNLLPRTEPLHLPAALWRAVRRE